MDVSGHKHVFDSEVGFVITSDGLGPIYSLQCGCKKGWAYYRLPQEKVERWDWQRYGWHISEWSIRQAQQGLIQSPPGGYALKNSKTESPYNPSPLTKRYDSHQPLWQRAPGGKIRPARRLVDGEGRGNLRSSRIKEPDVSNFPLDSPPYPARASGLARLLDNGGSGGSAFGQLIRKPIWRRLVNWFASFRKDSK